MKYVTSIATLALSFALVWQTHRYNHLRQDYLSVCKSADTIAKEAIRAQDGWKKALDQRDESNRALDLATEGIKLLLQQTDAGRKL